MTNEPIINARFKKFCENYELQGIPEDEAFEQFVNIAILTQHQPDAFNADSELVDFIGVGGPGDTGIDGIAIKVNGILVKSTDEIRDIISKFSRISIEFIFIQSKNKSHFSVSEMNSFISGVRNFLSATPDYPFNDKIKEIYQIKGFLVSEDITFYWKESPIVRLYYVVMGKWNNDPLHEGTKKQAEKDILSNNFCSKVDFQIIDSERFKCILDENENKFSTVIEVIDTMDLTPVEKVENSCVALCKASELYKLLVADGDVIRKSLFNDNVRDYQGDNTVNSEIYDTINSDPQKFVLLNNGIAVVCDEFVPNNRKLRIENPQIVNGCQTCHVIYNARKEGLDLSDTTIVMKIIATKNVEISNEIVKGTNRQSIVLEEAFEGTKKFHKDLEIFFNAYVSDFQDKIYYERRAKQYNHNPLIKPIQKINLRILTQYFVGSLMYNPHLAHKHESILLKEFGKDIFLEEHSKLPYFAIAYAFYTLEGFFRKGKFSRDLKPFKAHILMIYCWMVAGKRPHLSQEKSIDKFSESILKSLYNTETAKGIFNDAINLFNTCKTEWTQHMKKSKYAMKDVQEFTELILKTLNNGKKINISKTEGDIIKNIGVVKKVMKNRAGIYCGYIKLRSEEFFFHFSNNPELDYSNLEGKKVSFEISKADTKRRIQALNIKVID